MLTRSRVSKAKVQLPSVQGQFNIEFRVMGNLIQWANGSRQLSMLGI